MRHLVWLVQLFLISHVAKIIKTRGAILSKESTFQLQKYPAVSRYNDDFIKNISKICYDYNDTRTDEIVTATIKCDSKYDNNTAKILKKFRNILQQFKNSGYKPIDEIEVGTERNNQFSVPYREEEKYKSYYEEPPLNILQQMKLNEQQQNWQQAHLQQQQNDFKVQQVLPHANNDSLGKAGKKKKNKKKKKKKKRKKSKPIKNKKKKQKLKPIAPLMTHPAHILFASPTQKPLLHYDNDRYTTEKPFQQHPLIPIKKIKYILRKNTPFKKKKKEYLNHLKHVLYPFVKFIAFFTIINPFSLAVFLFSLVSPVLLGFLGFIGLSFLIKPALNLLFSIKHTLSVIKHRKLQKLRRRQRLRDSRRPITIHKHYYKQIAIARPSPTRPSPAAPSHHHYQGAPPPHLKPKIPLIRYASHGRPHHQYHHQRHHLLSNSRASQTTLFNPLLPEVMQNLKNEKYFTADIKGHKYPFEQF